MDAFELIATIVTLSGLTIRQKIDVLHALFDFSRTGELTVDELTIFFRCVSSGCSKVDGNVVAPTVAELEKTAKWCFTKADRSLSMELAKREFDEFVFTDPRILHFLEYFSGDTRQVPHRKRDRDKKTANYIKRQGDTRQTPKKKGTDT